MTREEFDEKHYEMSLTAGMNQRYHQAKAGTWACWDRSFKISTGMVAVAGAITAFSGPGWFGAFLAIAAAMLAVSLNVLPFVEWSALHADMLRRWSDLREDIDALGFDVNGEPSKPLIERLRNLDAKIHRVCGLEPKVDKGFLRKCFLEEEQSRHQED